MPNNEDSAMPWERIDPPILWPQFGNYIVADRHLPDGTRQHMIHGHVEPGRVFNNAQIIGEADCPDARYSSQKSHLSVLPGTNPPNIQIDEVWVARDVVAQRLAGADRPQD